MKSNEQVFSISMLFISVLFISIFWYIQYLWKRRYLYKYASKVPGPKGWPIIGNALDFTLNSPDIYKEVMNLFSKHPKFAKMWYGPFLIYGVSKPEYLEKILCSSHALKKMYFYNFTRSSSGDGLVTAPVPIWKRHRKLIMPSLKLQNLYDFVPIFQKHGIVMTQQMEKFQNQKQFDFSSVISKCTIDIIFETAIGIETNAQIDDSPYNRWIERLLEIMFQRLFVVWYHFDIMYKWTKLYQEEQEIIKQCHLVVDNVIREKRTTRSTYNGRKVFIDHLIEQDVLPDKELRDEVSTFIAAGTDTTASSLECIFLMLAMHQDVQNKVYEEVKHLKEITPQDLSNMQYTERVIKETLRLFPVGAFIGRDMTNDITLEDGIILPKGSSVVIGIMPVHRSAEYWENPLEFDPDRFLPENVAKRHPFAYIPFSAGPRNCVGLKYAMMSMKVLVALVLQKFEIFTSYKTVEEISVKLNITLKPNDRFSMWIRHRATK